MSSHGTFIRGAAILAAAGVIVRFIGAAMRIILAALMGDEGIGLYQMAYPIYSSLLAISTAGIPVAVSKLVSENIALKDYREAMRVFRIALVILSLSGLLITLALLLSAEFVAVHIVEEPRAVYPLLAIAPAIFFVTIMSALRGFFQGQQIMLPTAASQFVEQIGRVVASVVLTVVLLPVGLEFAAAGAASGAVAGGVVGLLLMAFIYWRTRPGFQACIEQQQRHQPVSYRNIIKRIFSLAIPITFGSLILPLITLIDLAVVPQRLQEAGFTVEQSTALYGQLTGMAGSVIYFPNVITIALSMSLVPAISEAFALRNRTLIGSRTAMAIKLTMLFSIPATLGLYLLAEPITWLLFSNREAGYPLAVMAWSLIPLSLYSTTTGIMQGMGRPMIPVMNMVYGGIVKTALAWYLTAIPALHVGGAALATVVGMAVAALLNLWYIYRMTGWRFRPVELIILPGIAVLIMSLQVRLTYRWLFNFSMHYLSENAANGAAAIITIGLGIAVFSLALLIAGGVTREELLLVPRIGERLAALAERLKLIR